MEFGFKGIPFTFTGRDSAICLVGTVLIYMPVFFFINKWAGLATGIVVFFLLCIVTSRWREIYGPEWLWTVVLYSGIDGDEHGKFGRVRTSRHMSHAWVPGSSRFRTGSGDGLAYTTHEQMWLGPMTKAPLIAAYTPKVDRTAAFPQVKKRGLIDV